MPFSLEGIYWRLPLVVGIVGGQWVSAFNSYRIILLLNQELDESSWCPGLAGNQVSAATVEN
ncbi:hypothetical protein BDZ89DRAFT_1138833 [Hymenopellis radicata]|nr:hypothetical protein BDZ89DRAFT_1138833 [Hymenopellis radicata]